MLWSACLRHQRHLTNPITILSIVRYSAPPHCHITIFLPLAVILKTNSLTRLILYPATSKKPSAVPRILHFQLNSSLSATWHPFSLPSHHKVLKKNNKKPQKPKNQTKNPTPNKPHTHRPSKCLFPFPAPLSVLLLPSPFQKGKQPLMSTLLDLLSPKQSSLS